MSGQDGWKSAAIEARRQKRFIPEVGKACNEWLRLTRHASFRAARTALFDAYSSACLARVWSAEHFSWWLTQLMHRFPDATPFMQKLQQAELRHVVSSRSAARVLAENYVGLPFS